MKRLEIINTSEGQWSVWVFDTDCNNRFLIISVHFLSCFETKKRFPGPSGTPKYKSKKAVAPLGRLPNDHKFVRVLQVLAHFAHWTRGGNLQSTINQHKNLRTM